jgi:hypothetical protein
MRTCFGERESADAGLGESSLDVLLSCVPDCYDPRLLFDYTDREFLACVTGTPRPVLLETTAEMNWAEGEPDEDGGLAPECLAECFPTWQ